MAALELLISQHREAMDLLARIRAETVNGGARIRMMGALAEVLTLHTTLEEQFIYPLLRDEGFGDLAARMYFTPDGLEQATRLSVATHRAGRLQAADTRSAVGACMWSTMRPSARNRAPSA